MSNPLIDAHLTHMDARSSLKPCVKCLISVGYGLKATASMLGIPKTTVIRIRDKAGIKSTAPRESVFRAKTRQSRSKELTVKRMDEKAALMAAMPPKPIRIPKTNKELAEEYVTRYHTKPGFRLKELCRRRMKKLLQGIPTKSGIELIGCTSEQLRSHIEKQFKRGMNWGNSGTGKGKWHLDHIIPCAMFNQHDEAQRKQCWHWTNLRPMWSLSNISKGDRLEKHEQTNFLIEYV